MRASSHRFRWGLVPIVLSALWAEPAAAQVILRVDPAAPSGGDGFTWATAYRGLHEALIDAAALSQSQLDTTIWLRAGIYPTDGVGAQSSGRQVAFELVDGVCILGGFNGTETDPSLRDPLLNTTVLSGEIGDPSLTSDNAYTVVRFIAPSGPITRTAELDGVTIERGNANAPSGDQSTGGALLTRFAKVTIRNCVLRNNFARQGGAVYSRNGELSIESSQFISNTASADAGAVYSQSDLIIVDSVFNSNSASFGGAVLACCRPIEIRRSSFQGNFASWGGAIYTPSGTPILTRLDGFGNSASRGGFLYSGVALSAANLRLGSNVANNGGGIYTTAAVSLSNAIFTRNNAFENGGAIHVASGNMSLAHISALDNGALIFGGFAYAGFGSITVDNSIITENSDSTGTSDASQLYSSGLAQLLVRASIMSGLTGSVSVIDVVDVAPQYANPAGPDGILGTIDDDFSLSPMSPAIDAADPLLLPPDSADIDGDGDVLSPLPWDIQTLTRTFGLAPDRGAYEFVPDATLCPGDINNDFVVDLADFNILAINFGMGPEASRNQGDLNGDGFVDLSDFNILAVTFGSVCTP